MCNLLANIKDMKHVGQLIKKHIEDHRLVKRKVAEQLGCTYNYLSSVYKKETLNMSFYDEICKVIGLDPALAFEDKEKENDKNDPYLEIQYLKKMLDEKERMIQHLLSKSGT